jgi:hypothetical protein
VKIFDPRGRWLLDRQEARPYGEGSILREDSGSAAAGAQAAPAQPPGAPN